MFRHYDVPYEYGDCATATYTEDKLNTIKIENVEYLIDEQKWPRNDDFPVGKGITSGFRSGLNHVKFFELSPWANYIVLSTDYTSYSIVYNCDPFVGGVVKIEYLWVLTRDQLEVNSADWITMRDKVWAIIREKVGDHIDPETDLRPT